MAGTLNPASPTWTLQTTTTAGTAAGTIVTEVWTGPKSTEATFSATKAYGAAHGTYSGSKLYSKGSNPDPSQTLGSLTLVYQPIEAGANSGQPIGPVGTDYLTFQAEPYDVEPISPGLVDFGGPQATTEYRYVFIRTQVVDSFTWSIANVSGYFKGKLGAGNGDAAGKPAGVSDGGAGDATKWSSVLESVRESDGAVEIVTRHTYSPV